MSSVLARSLESKDSCVEVSYRQFKQKEENYFIHQLIDNQHLKPGGLEIDRFHMKNLTAKPK